MSDYKSFRFTGGAAADLGQSVKGGKRTRKTKGGNEEIDPTFKNAQITKVGGASSLFPVSISAPYTSPPVPAPSVPSAPSVPAPVPAPSVPPAVVEGGAKQIKVELKKKHVSKKVTLNPKREVAKPKPYTKKARKFVLGVSSMHKRMTRAKKLQHTVKKMPLDVLRKQLIQSKLIKESSKAPEAILRQIAADSELVGKKVL